MREPEHAGQTDDRDHQNEVDREPSYFVLANALGRFAFADQQAGDIEHGQRQHYFCAKDCVIPPRHFSVADALEAAVHDNEIINTRQ